MEDLVAFLRARLDRDEAVARACMSAAWKVAAGGTVRVDPAGEAAPERAFVATAENEAYAEHIARMDPHRVLRQAGAQRRLIALYEKERWARQRGVPGGGVLEDVLRGLASQYSDHPAYRPEWA
ncbi:DUF6221 family protein [Actinocorallia populi]|uniref:DUF6221 family protein n=1 Tax=Actinocorallia populi TaxID=2079200 RepID=UPI00130022C8|nr:DUF6221 family protein [Actinocorallia populi]